MINSKLDRAVNAIGGAVLALLILSTTLNIIGYWITGRRSGQVDDLVLSLFVWVVYIGVGSLYAGNGHISVSFLVELLPKGLQKAVRLFDDLVMLVASCAFAYYALKLSLRGLTLLTPVLKLPFFYIDISLVLGFGYVIIDIGWKSVKFIRKLFLTLKQGSDLPDGPHE